jgi:RNA polymerase sigma-70 factor, ECF subfamily
MAEVVTTGREEAFDATEHLAALFDRHWQRLYRLAVRMGAPPEEASDLVQETFLRAARRRRSLPAEEGAAEAWLVRVLVNLCRDRYRRLAVRRREAIEPPSPSHPDPAAATVARLTVAVALRNLPPRRRAVIVLHELEGLSAREVGRLLGLSPVTVRWHLAVGRRQLTRWLELEGDSDEQD